MSGPAPSATPLPSTPTDPDGSDPAEQFEIASSSERDPAPFVLFGTLLFALAAAAGQVLRSDPTLIRRLVTGFDGVRGSTSAAHTARMTGGSTPPPASEASVTLTGHEPNTLTDQTLGGQTLTDFVDPNSVAPTLSGPAPAGQGGIGGLGGQDGGLSNLSDGAGGGFDSLAKSSLTGQEANGFGGADGLGQTPQSDLSGQPSEIQADLKEPVHSERPTDYQPRPLTEADMAPQTAHGGGIGGGQGSDALARGSFPSGSELANGNGGFWNGAAGQGSLGGGQGGDLLARGGGASADALANPPSGPSAPVDSGLGGVHSGNGIGGGEAGSLARGLTPGGVDLAGLPTGANPGDLGFQGGLGGHQGVGDSLARGLSPSAGGPLPNVAGTVLPPDAGVGGAGPVWLAAGALARAGSLDWDGEDSSDEQPTRAQEPPTRAFACPSCRRQLPFGPRFCGYCGEPLDKTLA
jgi:hypothetical protein